jgi:hypothetical protein
MEIVKNSAKDCYPAVQKTTLVIMERLQQVLQMEVRRLQCFILGKVAKLWMHTKVLLPLTMLGGLITITQTQKALSVLLPVTLQRLS